MHFIRHEARGESACRGPAPAAISLVFSPLPFLALVLLLSFLPFLASPSLASGHQDSGSPAPDARPLIERAAEATAVYCLDETQLSTSDLSNDPVASDNVPSEPPLLVVDNDAQEIHLPLVADSDFMDFQLPSALVFGPYTVPFATADAIVRASSILDIDVAYMFAVAHRESLFDPLARAPTSSATGLFQFIESTWFATLRAYGPDHGYSKEADMIVQVGDRLTVIDEEEKKRILDLRLDPFLSTLMAGELSRADASHVSAKVGRTLRTSEMYIAHFLGAGGSTRLIRAVERTPRTSAVRLFPRAARANRSVFYAGRGRSARAFNAVEIHRNLTASIDRRMAHFEEVKTIDFDTLVVNDTIYASFADR